MADKNFIMKWTPEGLLRATDAGFRSGLEKAAIFYEGELKRVISKPGPLKSKLTAGQRRRLEAAGEERRASVEGEPPRKRRGTLWSSITHMARLDGLVQRIGSALAYARHLEWGTRKMGPRPYFRVTLRRWSDRLTSIIIGELKRGSG